MAIFIFPFSLSSSSSPSTTTSLAYERRCLFYLHSSCHGFINHLKMDLLCHRKHTLFALQNRSTTMRSNMVAKSSGEEYLENSMTPFQPRSETGLFLSQLLHTNPDLVPSAVEHELERLSGNRKAESCQSNVSSASAHDKDLYRRIAEFKSQERFNALEEILYMLIVRKFIDARLIMISNVRILISSTVPWDVQIKEFESIHSLEVLELIREHTLLVLGKRGVSKYFGKSMFAHLSKMSLKEIYASSVTYGYFLRRLYNRFQLEKAIELYPDSGDAYTKVGSSDIAAAMAVLKDLQGSTSQIPNSTQMLTSEFLAYITSFDAETLRGFTIIRSKESRSVSEKHARALFQDMENGSSDKEDVSKISFLKSKGLVLEAVAFGSFLWDVETYVDGFYSLT